MTTAGEFPCRIVDISLLGIGLTFEGHIPLRSGERIRVRAPELGEIVFEVHGIRPPYLGARLVPGAGIPAKLSQFFHQIPDARPRKADLERETGT